MRYFLEEGNPLKSAARMGWSTGRDGSTIGHLILNEGPPANRKSIPHIAIGNHDEAGEVPSRKLVTIETSLITSTSRKLGIGAWALRGGSNQIATRAFRSLADQGATPRPKSIPRIRGGLRGANGRMRREGAGGKVRNMFITRQDLGNTAIR